MVNEITAKMLAREMCRMDGQDPDDMVADATPAFSLHLKRAADHLIATRALAALQAEQQKDAPSWGEVTWAPLAQPTEAPGRVRCWRSLSGSMTDDAAIAGAWARMGHVFTPGHFVPEGQE